MTNEEFINKSNILLTLCQKTFDLLEEFETLGLHRQKLKYTNRQFKEELEKTLNSIYEKSGSSLDNVVKVYELNDKLIDKLLTMNIDDKINLLKK